MSPAHQSTPLPQGLDILVSDWQRTPTSIRDEFRLAPSSFSLGAARISPSGGHGLSGRGAEKGVWNAYTWNRVVPKPQSLES